jgi:serine/threonine protein kinase
VCAARGVHSEGVHTAAAGAGGLGVHSEVIHTGDGVHGDAVHSESSSSAGHGAAWPLQHFLIMEACAGGDLFDLLERTGGPLDGELVRRLFRGVVAGLLHLHSLGVAHRDIKPEVSGVRIEHWGDQQ